MKQRDHGSRTAERTFARERLVEEARRLADGDHAPMLGGHLAGQLAARRTMRFVALAAVAALVGVAALALEGWR